MRERDIFIEVLEKDDPSDRSALLDKVCQADVELRARVEQLLAEHERQESFILDTPAVAFDATVGLPHSEGVGKVIGPYRLLQQIGEGGMGVVFMAEQTEPLQRTVAIKIIKPGMDTRQVIARFEAERQALAMMDHPNIAKVLDAGTTESGRPYFVMELVKGVPITRYCDERQLPLRARLELFMQVCQAVQHAHQKGVIHRDLKPTNVQVAEYDHNAVPKVIDFGVAKATVQKLTDRTMFTELGQLVGTVEYMSPEQAKLNQLDIDTRSDIYSLGVLLYELLTGSTPFGPKRLQKAAFDEMLRIVREEEPPKPSTRLSTTDQLADIAASRGAESNKLSGQVKGELDWIVMKALEKDRNRRYATANSLALDLERYLADEPVEACPPSATYRFRKLASRNKAVLLTVGVIALSLVLGTVISIWQATLARQAEALAQRRLESEQEASARATAEAVKAKSISELMQNMLAFANPAAAKGSDYTVRQMLDDFSAGLGEQLRDQPEAEAAIRSTIGNAYRGLYSFDKAEPHFQSALALRKQLFGPTHAEVAQSLIDYSANDYGRGDVIAAEAKARKALAIHRKQKLDNSLAMRVLSALQYYLVALDKYDGADQIAKEALEIANRDPTEHPEEATVLHNLAHAATYQGDHVNAEGLARKSLELHERLHGNDHPETAHARFVLATSLYEQQKLDEAEVQYREALQVHRKHFDDSQTPVLVALAGLAQTLRAKGDQSGLDALRTMIELSSSEPKGWEGWHFRGSFFATVSDWEQADTAFTNAAARESDPNHLRYFYYLALIRMARNDLAGYREACGALVKRAGQSTESDSPYMAVWACVLGPDALGDPDKIVTMVERAGEGHSKEPRYLATLGAALYRAGLYDEASKRFDEAIAATSSESSDARVVTYSQLFLAMIHQRLGETDAAQRLRNQAVQAIDQLMLPSPANYAESWDSLLPLQLLRQEVDRVLFTTNELSN